MILPGFFVEISAVAVGIQALVWIDSIQAAPIAIKCVRVAYKTVETGVFQDHDGYVLEVEAFFHATVLRRCL